MLPFRTGVHRIGGSVVVCAYADGTTFYSVPASKRLTLKGYGLALSVLGLSEVTLAATVSGDKVMQTIVLSASTKLKLAAGGEVFASGYLTDDNL